MAYDHGHGDCASTCCSEPNQLDQSKTNDLQTPLSSQPAYPLHKLCQVLGIKLQEMETAALALDRDCEVQSKIRSLLMGFVGDIAMVQLELEDHL
jgi:hypothetical protein